MAGDDGFDVDPGETDRPPRSLRPDARRSMDALLKAALDVFSDEGVDAPYRRIATAAGVGMGTIYRHFPDRSDLIRAVYRHELDRCAAAAPELADTLPADAALEAWMQRLVDFVNAKRGMAAALHSGDPAYTGLATLLESTLRPALQRLLDAAAAAGAIREGVDAWELIRAVSSLATPHPDVAPDHARRMVRLLVDGLRHATSPRR